MAGNPVVLVHGISDTIAQFRRMKFNLEGAGLDVIGPNLVPNDGRVGLAALARQLEHYVNTNFPAGETIDLVGFSMGGLVSRYYLQRLDGIRRARRFVTIGTPHQGTWTACLSGSPGARDMRPGSGFLHDLNSDVAMLGRISFSSIWTPLDLMIVPAASSRVPVGRSIRVWSAAHPLLIRDRQVLRLVLGILRDG